MPVIGSLGIVLRSKKLGLIDEVGAFVQKLLDAGMFLDQQLLTRALESVEE